MVSAGAGGAQAQRVQPQWALRRDRQCCLHFVGGDRLELLDRDTRSVQQERLGILEPRAGERDRDLLSALESVRRDRGNPRVRGRRRFHPEPTADNQNHEYQIGLRFLELMHRVLNIVDWKPD